MIDANRLRQIDTDHNTKVIRLLQPGQEYKTWCYAKQGWAKVARTDSGLLVKLPGQRKAQPMELAATVQAIVDAHHG